MNKEECRAYMKAYRQLPEVKAKQKAYRQLPEVKAKQKAYRQLPEVKAKQKAYMKTWSQRPEVKAKMKASTAIRTNREQALKQLQKLNKELRRHPNSEPIKKQKQVILARINAPPLDELLMVHGARFQGAMILDGIRLDNELKKRKIRFYHEAPLGR